MTDLITSVTTAITIARRLKEISDRVKDAEFRGLVADLSLELAEFKFKLASVMEENVKLQGEIQALKNVDGDPCPSCRKRGWQLASSKPDEVFGDLGGVRRLYKCLLCGFSEEKLITPE